MFFVVNKEKVYAYVVSILTIVTLFFMSGVIKSDIENTQETSSTISNNTMFQNELVSNNEITQFNSNN